MNESGLQTWFVGGGYMLHKESISRKFIPIPAEDFYNSYISYIKGYDPELGDPFLPEITKKLKYMEFKYECPSFLYTRCT